MDRKKILVIDDEKSFTSMLSLNLEATGNYQVIVENDSENAVTVALKHRPDLILLDVIMPKMEGPDVAREIRSNGLLNKTPIVFLTATVREDEVREQNGMIGGNRFVAKPTSLNFLLDSIEDNIAFGN